MEPIIKIIPRDLIRRKYTKKTPAMRPYGYLEFQNKPLINLEKKQNNILKFFKQMKLTLNEIIHASR